MSGRLVRRGGWQWWQLAVVVAVVLLTEIAAAFPALALPGPAQPITPVNTAVVGTVSPTLTGGGQSGTGLSFQFKLSATDDPSTNTIWTSSWLGSPVAAVPNYYLRDGVTYSWKIGTKDSSGEVWSSVAKFTVNLRLGDQVANPFDSLGGVKVNLATGNLLFSVSSAQVQTVGGPLGVSFTYNSKQSPSVPQTPLPFGWQLSVDTQGSLLYEQVVKEGDYLVLVEPSGVTHPYQRSDANGNAWVPLDDDQAVVTQLWDGSNNVVGFNVLGEDGLTYAFDDAGRLRSATSNNDPNDGSLDNGQVFDQRSDPSYVYNGATGQLTNINDRLSPKGLALVYGNGTGSNCPTGSAPTGYLCQIQYSDDIGQMATTDLLYSSGKLVAIVNPGNERTDFSYNGSGQLTKIMSPLANDAVTAGQRTSSDLLKTIIWYDAGRVSEVQAPQALASDTGQAANIYTYLVPDTNLYSTRTDVLVWGTSAPNGYTRRVVMNSLGQVTQDVDMAGKATLSEWWPDDRIRWTQVPGGYENAGERTATWYDSLKRVTDVLGPGRPACFNGDQLSGTCNVPRQMKAYDGAATFPDGSATNAPSYGGLGAAYWTNATMSGAPFSHETGLDATGNLGHDWGLGAPASLGGDVDTWSAQYTGAIYIGSTASNYNFQLNADDGARLYIDDKLIIDQWTTGCCSIGTSFAYVPTFVGWHRIRVDYREDTLAAHLELYWTGPGISFQVVPKSMLTPGYNLVTSTRDGDGMRTNTEYTNPERGLPTATVADPAGLNLRTTMAYEAPGTSYGYGRLLTTDLPKGTAYRTTNDYYGGSSNEGAIDPCAATAPVANEPPAGAAQNIFQGGQLSRRVHPNPAGPDGSIVDTYRYDRMGRVMSVSSTNDANDPPSCTHYDARGRVRWTKDRLGRTSTTVYNGVLTTTTYTDSATTPGTENRTTTSEVDLTGRLYKYTDEWGTITTRKYDMTGRLEETDRQFPGQPNAVLTTQTYNTANLVATITDYASGVARTTTFSYDDGGNLTQIARPNGVTTNLGYGNWSGKLSSIATSGPWTPSGTIQYQGDYYDYSWAGRLMTNRSQLEKVNYGYDGAGRLTTVWDYVSGVIKRSYAYDANTNRCAAATSSVQATCDNSYLSDEADRATKAPGGYTTFNYDARGNLLSMSGTGVPGQSYSYDGREHATTVQDPTTATLSTLAPSGRVLQRQVKMSGSPYTVLSDTIYGFDGPGDSPAYSRPANGTWPTPMLLVENFTGTNSAAWSTTSTPSKWVTTSNDTTKKVDLQNNQGSLYVNGASARGTAQMTAVSDSEVSLTYQFNENTAGSNLRVFLKASGATGASQMPNAYRLDIASDSTSIKLQKFVGSTVTQIGSFAYTSGTHSNRLRLRVQGSTISAKAWNTGDGYSEPQAWSATATDSAVTASGVLQIAHSHTSGAHTVVVDDVVVKDLSKTSVTTMVNGPFGLLETDTDGEATYFTVNAHGDIDNSIDMAGGATWNYADEFGTPGSQDIPANHLGWLGSQQRYTEDQYGSGTSKGTTVRMGNRLYDSRLGRFLQKDPIEGGSANGYDYVSGDPINNMDLDGTRCWTGVARTERYGAWNAKKQRWENKTREICRGARQFASVALTTGGRILAGTAEGAAGFIGAVDEVATAGAACGAGGLIGGTFGALAGPTGMFVGGAGGCVGLAGIVTAGQRMVNYPPGAPSPF